MKIAKELAKEARRLGVCQEWHDKLQNLNSKRAMVEMYVRGIDFCLSNNYPSNDYIRANFKGVMEEFGVFLDDNISVTNISNCVLLGNTTANIMANEYAVSRIFAKNNSTLDIKAMGNAFVLIDVFDYCNVHVTSSDNAKVCIYKYGDSCNVDITQLDKSAIKIANKNTKTY